MRLPIFEALCKAGQKPQHVFCISVPRGDLNLGTIPRSIPRRPPFSDGFIEFAGADYGLKWWQVGSRVFSQGVGFLKNAVGAIIYPQQLRATGVTMSFDLDDRGCMVEGSIDLDLSRIALSVGNKQEIAATINGYQLGLAAYLFALCNISNIQVRDEPLARSARRRLADRGVTDDVRIKTLWIVPFSTKEPSTRRSQRLAPVPFHFVRGHFVTYTAAAPLFGKYVGTFWVAPHARGHRAYGEIEHRYAVAATDEDAADLKVLADV